MFENLYESYSRKRVQLGSLPYELGDDEEQYIPTAQTEELPQGLIEDEI